MGDLAQIESLPDSSLSASTEHSSGLVAANSRLYEGQDTGVEYSWSASSNVIGQWIQVDLLQAKWIHKVATQGRNAVAQWVTSYQLKYSLTNVEANFVYVTSPEDGAIETFDANFDMGSVVFNTFASIFAQFVRLYPQTWNNHISLRWEVYACYTGMRVLQICPNY